MKELALPDPVALQAFRQKFEAGRSFDLDDDLEFCPNLLTESDVSTSDDGLESSYVSSQGFLDDLVCR